MQTTYSPEQRAALLREFLQTFVDAVKAGGDLGAPGGVLYSAVCDKITLAQFQDIMGALVKTERVRQAGNLYFFVRDL